MAKQLFIGLVAEGPTDIRFLQNVVQRTFEDVAYNECAQEVEILTYELQNVGKGGSFADLVENAAFEGVRQLGAMTIEERFEHKFQPAITRLTAFEADDNYCTVLTPLIAVRMIEGWILADKQLFKAEINTSMSDSDLGIARDPETISDPKRIISDAIRISSIGQPKRRKELSIADLYAPIGAKISLDALNRLPSYRKFRACVEDTFRELHYII